MPDETGSGSQNQSTGTGNESITVSTNQKLLERLQDSYKEVLDATKHQDDKIGRLFTGVSFLTAAALAVANLNSSKLLFRVYTNLPGVSLAVISLGIYLILVILCVTVLISSLATPLRLPGLEDRSALDAYGPKWVDGVRASQIYFGAIARLPIGEWNRKWLAIEQDSDSSKTDAELKQSLVLEIHNLAVRTQFKSNRTSEAVVIFKFALMFLGVTAVLCIAASLTGENSELPPTTRWAVGAVIAAYVFLHFQDQIRYSRQTIDEIKGAQNISIAVLRYGWAACTALWALYAGSGYGQRTGLVVLVVIGTALLITSTWMERRRSKVKGKKDPLHWAPPPVALVVGLILSVTASSGSYYQAITSATVGALAITLFALCTPTLRSWRDAYRAGR